MKKFLSTLCLGALALGAVADDYVVYNNGTLNDELHVYGWWNDGSNFKAANPDGSGEVWKFYPADGSGAASMGLNMEAPQNTGIFHNATLNFSWYAEGTGNYTVRLTSVAEQNYNFTVTADNAGKWQTVSLPVAEYFPTVAQQWNDNKKQGVGYVFSIIVAGGSSDAAIYLNNITYTNVDDSWTPPVREVAAPETVPTPTTPAEDVISIFSSAYTPATTFNIGYWGQTTSPSLQIINGSNVYYLQNFNYLGWELNSDINISDYDYMHVDLWTAEETAFGFTPISRGGSETEKSIVMPNVVLNDWNSYDISIKQNWSKLDLEKIFQVKFDQGSGEPEIYIANVYFWKDPNNEGGGNGGSTGVPGATFSGKASGTLPQVLIGESENRVDLDVTLSYSITYNEDKTLTISFTSDTPDFDSVVGITPQLFIEGAYVGNFNGTRAVDYSFTTSSTYEADEQVNMGIYCAYNAAAATITIPTYTVGSSNEVSAVVFQPATLSNVDVYNLNGVKVASKVDFNNIKSSLTPGIYIVGGKKVVVK